MIEKEHIFCTDINIKFLFFCLNCVYSNKKNSLFPFSFNNLILKKFSAHHLNRYMHIYLLSHEFVLKCQLINCLKNFVHIGIGNILRVMLQHVQGKKRVLIQTFSSIIIFLNIFITFFNENYNFYVKIKKKFKIIFYIILNDEIITFYILIIHKILTHL